MKIVCTTQCKGTNKKLFVLSALRAKCFSITSVKLWNVIHIALRNCKKYLRFQKNYKTSILDRQKKGYFIMRRNMFTVLDFGICMR